ncbi:unnamed protein product [Cylindrotheca closterium]|uniref:Fibronectin type-III domain-containing protein n=1 Tax=Cylindrotheca closterium TaxID=2856 RepID=A0AAD2GDS4_9STRA|nr:unnamed protein product [Cylindrotheca closterium]
MTTAATFSMARDQIVLIDARSTTLTISWPPIQDVAFYLLEYRTNIENQWEMLADDLTLTEIRKTQLDCKKEYFFRVAAIYKDDTLSGWISHKEPFQPLPVKEDREFSMAPPVVNRLKEKETLMIEWEAIEEDIYAFELQFRQNRGGQPWITISEDLHSNQVRKRNLTCKWGYQFRVRPVTDHANEPWSLPSEPVIANGVKSPFPKILMKGLKTTPQPPPPQRPPKKKEKPLMIEENHEDTRRQRYEPDKMDAPWFKPAEESEAMIVNWNPVEYATGYELQMIKCMKKRAQWKTIAANLQGTQVKKKNLTNKAGYQFRIRPNGFRKETEFSDPSNIAIAN